MISEKDKSIVRELAVKYMSLVATDEREKMLQRFRDTNDLKIVRPPVILDEIPWYQMNIDNELTCVCEDERVRKVELHFRKALFYIKHLRADHLFEPFFRVNRSFDSTGMGVDRKDAVAHIKRTDNTNNIISREFEDILADESVLERMHDPVFTLRPDKDAENLEFYTTLLGDSIPVKLCGRNHFNFHPWDDIVYMRGVEPVMIDMYDRPEYLHALMQKFVSAAKVEMDFIEKNLNVDNQIVNIHCTPATVSGLADEGLKATWYRGRAQGFGIVSPDMFEEFEVNYIKPIAESFAYTYYGCCEPLDDKIPSLKKISNLRKIGCSPWANVEKCAEQIGGDFVLSRKPNPAYVAIKTDTEVIRKEVEDTVKTCIKYGCPFDYVLKDISTVSNRPENLIVWAQTVSEVLDKYF